MAWNYRVCYRPSVTGGGYQIHEVFYDEDGGIKFYSAKPVSPHGDIVDELYEDVAKFWKAFDREPLNLDLIDKLYREKREHEKRND